VARSVWFWETVNVERSGFSWSFGLEIFYSWGSVGTDGTDGTDGTEGNRGQVPVFLWLAGSRRQCAINPPCSSSRSLLVRVLAWRWPGSKTKPASKISIPS